MLNSTTRETQAEARRRNRIREVILRHRGEVARIASGIIGRNGKPIHPINVSQYLNGIGRSKRVAEACERRAIQLVMAEEAAKIAAEHRPHDISVREVLDELRHKKQ